jgi:CheY-like chemotaxis protein
MESSFNGLLDLSKLDAGIVKPKLQPVEIDELFDRISQVFRPLALAHGIELRFRSDGEHVMSDPTLIEQVVGNLVANAIRATQTGGILLAARRRGSELRIEVWDTGHGIPAEDLQRIFEDYVQLNNPSRDRKRGLGLGLAIAGRSVALLGSRIEVASRLGRGSCFRFTQPLCEPPSAGLAPSAEPARPGRKTGLPLLLVEDDEDVRAALTNLLSRWGFPFVAVANAEEGLALVSGGARFGLVITDQRLSGEITGLEMIRKVRSMLIDPPPAIIITGEVDSPLLRSAESEGILVLHKPVEASRLKLLLG